MREAVSEVLGRLVARVREERWVEDTLRLRVTVRCQGTVSGLRSRELAVAAAKVGGRVVVNRLFRLIMGNMVAQLPVTLYSVSAKVLRRGASILDHFRATKVAAGRRPCTPEQILAKRQAALERRAARVGTGRTCTREEIERKRVEALARRERAKPRNITF